MLGLNDIVTIKTRTQTTDGRGGVTTSYATKIASLTCSLQAIRREELSFELAGENAIEPYILMYETITNGPEITQGDIVEHVSWGTFLVTTVIKTSGKGAHSEAILRKSTSNAHVK